MKNFILFLIILIPLADMAQSGVILPNGIDLPKVTTLAACTAPEKGRMVFNTTDNKAWYCNGVNWQEMTGGGFTLPYSGTANTNVELFKIVNGAGGVGVWAESNSGYGLYAKSNTDIAIKGVSTDSYGVEGRSVTGAGVRGLSTESHGVVGYSTSYSGYGIYATGVNGQAGYFSGNLKVSNNLIVDDDKGIIQNSNGTQLKYYTRKIVFNNQSLGGSGTFISDTLSIGQFSSNPVVYIGNIENQLNDYYKVSLSIVSVTENSFRVRFYNTSNDPINFNATWNIIAIGPK